VTMGKNRIAFLFPGQGAQEVGMGSELAEEYDIVNNFFDRAEKILNLDLKRICFEGPEYDLNLTENTQPALFVLSSAVNRILNDNGIYPELVAGHSLGEYSALTAAGGIDFRSNLRLVRERGRAMEEALPAGLGSMAAIIGLDLDQVENICSHVNGVCEIANFNTPNQFVISGEKEAVSSAVERCKKEDARKVIELPVSGPFHSSLMEPAVGRLEEALADVEIKDLDIPLVANVSAQKTSDAAEIKENLLRQLTSSVRWVETIENMAAEGIDTFVEVGPGRVLKGLLLRIDRSLTCYNTRNPQDLEEVLEELT